MMGLRNLILKVGSISIFCTDKGVCIKFSTYIHIHTVVLHTYYIVVYFMTPEAT